MFGTQQLLHVHAQFVLIWSWISLCTSLYSGDGAHEVMTVHVDALKVTVVVLKEGMLSGIS